MGSRRPTKHRPTTARDASAFRPELERRIRLLKASGERWDASDQDDEVVVMASLLRTILADGDGNRLLDRVVPVKRSVLFLDSVLPGSNLLRAGFAGVGGLTLMQIGGDGRQIVPLCHQPGPLPPPRFLRFRQWWGVDKPVILDGRGWSRRFAVMEAANTDGVHVSGDLDDDYVQLQGASPHWTMTNSRGEQVPVRGVLPAAIRQIAWEVERTVSATLASEDLKAIAQPVGGT